MQTFYYYSVYQGRKGPRPGVLWRWADLAFKVLALSIVCNPVLICHLDHLHIQYLDVLHGKLGSCLWWDLNLPWASKGAGGKRNLTWSNNSLHLSLFSFSSSCAIPTYSTLCIFGMGPIFMTSDDGYNVISALNRSLRLMNAMSSSDVMDKPVINNSRHEWGGTQLFKCAAIDSLSNLQNSSSQSSPKHACWAGMLYHSSKNCRTALFLTRKRSLQVLNLELLHKGSTTLNKEPEVARVTSNQFLPSL